MAAKQKKQDKSAQPGQVAVSASSPGKITELVQYFEDAKTELGKVSWPTKKEIKATSIAVLILVVVMSIFLGLADLMLSKVMEFIFSIGL